MSASQALAAFAHDLRFDDIPPDVIERAKIYIIDTAAAMANGAAAHAFEQDSLRHPGAGVHPGGRERNLLAYLEKLELQRLPLPT